MTIIHSEGTGTDSRDQSNSKPQQKKKTNTFFSLLWEKTLTFIQSLVVDLCESILLDFVFFTKAVIL